METIKGFRDIEDSSRRIAIRNIIEGVFQLYGFKPVETPIIEYEEFVKGNNQNDEAVSDIFKLKDKGNRNLALRYELTFQLKRLAKNKKLPYRRYEIGSVFRDEPIGQNRWRQFTQCDADIVGSTLKDEAEILKIISEILERLNIDFTVYINNRKLLNEILNDLKIPDNKKTDVIKEIDKLDKLSESEIKQNLKKYNAEKALEIFKSPVKFFEKYPSYKEIKELKKACRLFKVDVAFLPYLARGLSYYNGSVFEIKTKEIKETICAGGSYLINGIQSTGFSFGLDRLELLAKLTTNKNQVLIISLNQDKPAIELSEKIRSLKISSNVFFGKPSKALEYANSYQIPFVIFLGEDEIKKKKFKLKNLNSGKEKLIEEKDLEREMK
ncbi:MAG: ATP phosphoribosyltransferase regulatory subunit [Nanoarchaeota archaeon]|nr:ATP phosphoribosyltransferase regulatory subunit [Nanoarchaeota archaeon]